MRATRKTVYSLIVGVSLLVAVSTIEVGRWWIAGGRASWVVLKDPNGDGVSMASTSEAFVLLLRSQVSPAWAEKVIDNNLAVSQMDVDSVRAAYDSMKLMGRVIDLPNGTHAQIVERMEFANGQFRSPSPSSLAEQRREGRFDVVEIRVREGRFKGATGWTLPELVQHEVSWP